MPGVSASEALDKYHEYLTRNYVGGCERFFSPVGFLDEFQRKVEVKVQDTREHVFAKSVDDAASKLESVVEGGEGVFDLTAEPGTGKTSVLPFRFPTKRVIVALPTPFDAWAAYQMATGPCGLKLKGLNLGDSKSSVIFTDSYLAAKALLSNYLDYDVLIVDECDSPRGVTRFLAEVRAPGKVLVRMSASHGRTTSGPSRSFRVTESKDMPDVRGGLDKVADFVKKEHKARSLVLVPDADTALDMATKLPDARVVCSKSRLPDIASAIVNQEGPRLYIADDVCARGLNLNLDALFDCQLVAESGSIRELTEAELYQRKNRVGRNRAGWYYSPGLDVKEVKESDIDLVRHNVVRAVAEVPQRGAERLRVTKDELPKLIRAEKEPYVQVMLMRSSDVAVTSSSSGTRPNSEGFSSPVGSSRPPSRTRSNSSDSVTAPAWLFAFTGAGHTGKPGVTGHTKNDRYVIKRGTELAFMRRKSSSSDSDSDSKYSDRRSLQRRMPGHGGSFSSGRHVREGSRALLPIVESAPYAVAERRMETQHRTLNLPNTLPIMDLTQLTYDLDWPSLIRERLAVGGDLPTLVPPASWRHTSVGGVGTDWFRRLDDIAVGDPSFAENEFEVVCRAWNKLVAQAWVKKTPGLSGVSNFDRLEFCARYFQSYFILASAE